MGKETKIPALTEAELKKIEEIETSVVAAIKDLRAAVINLDGLLHKNTTSKDLKEFYKWVRICDLEMEGLIGYPSRIFRLYKPAMQSLAFQ